MDQAVLLARYRPWLRTVAGDMVGLNLVDDLAAEGWIAMWRASQDDRDAAVKAPLDWWLKRQAMFRMRQCVRDWFTPAKQRQHVLVDDVTSVIDLPETLPAVEIAYHHGEICAALNQLTPREREYVAMRFWGGATPALLAAHFGYKPHGLWRTAQPKLALSLAHLAEVAS